MFSWNRLGNRFNLIYFLLQNISDRRSSNNYAWIDCFRREHWQTIRSRRRLEYRNCKLIQQNRSRNIEWCEFNSLNDGIIRYENDYEYFRQENSFEFSLYK